MLGHRQQFLTKDGGDMTVTQKVDGSRRILWRFLRLIIPSFVIAVSVSLYFATNFTFGNERLQLANRMENLTWRTSLALGTIDHANFAKASQPLLGLLLADSSVSCAVIVDRLGNIVSAAPPNGGCATGDTTGQVDAQLNFPDKARLYIRYNTREIEARVQAFRAYTLLALLAGFLTAVGSSWYSFQRTVGSPLKAMVDAIYQTKITGKPVRVNVQLADEVGEVISAFNDMQERLETEATRNTAALRRLDYVYNDMPALMFSLDAQGMIRTVSGHWLEATGFDRDEISGVHFSAVLSVETSSELQLIMKQINGGNRVLRDIPLELRRKDGSIMNVMLAAVPDIDGDKASLLCVLSDISALKSAQTKLERQATTDHLTGLANRKGLSEHLANLSDISTAAPMKSALLFIDLDNFKTVNDTLGHHAGDELLRVVMDRVSNTIARNDFLARLGGDEFAVVLHGLRQDEEAQYVADRILAAVGEPLLISGSAVNVGASIGIASFSNKFSPEEVLRQADLAMYKSKQSGKNSWSLYTADLTASMIAREVLVQKIRTGLAENHFRFYLQPIVDLQTLSPAGAEALLRMQCPKDGLMPPQEIVKTAEETGLIEQISAWSVTEGFRIANDRAEHFKDKNRYLSINLSPRQVNRVFINDLALRLLEKPDLAKSMVFEITETALFNSGENIAEILTTLRQTGARVALDDFGTGYSSLGHLGGYPVDLIKLDRSFLKDLNNSTEDGRRKRGLVRATATMAHELGVSMVAEGIEDMATMTVLRDFGIKYGQGYLFSRPMPEAQCAQWLGAFTKKVPASAPAKPAGAVPRLVASRGVSVA
jgi:diguanylate cyclase (GGDEF)-like protein/PAS domain S-box-containing protein